MDTVEIKSEKQDEEDNFLPRQEEITNNDKENMLPPFPTCKAEKEDDNYERILPDDPLENSEQDELPEEDKLNILKENHNKEEEETTPVPQYKCPWCFKEFHRLAKFKYHESTHSDVEKNTIKPIELTRIYQCPWCPLGYRKFGQLKRHKVTKHSFDENSIEFKRPYKCSHCPKRFSRSTDLRRHQQRLHTHPRKKSLTRSKGEKPFKCDLCNKFYADNSYLAKHKRFHMSADSNKFKCKFCDMKFFRSFTRKIHMQQEHGNRFTCDICRIRFSSEASQKRHIKRKHSESTSPSVTGNTEDIKVEDSLKPELEQKVVVKTEQDDEQHTRFNNTVTDSHKSYKYNCKLCDMKFCRSSLRKIHMNQLHGNKFKCDICEIRFSTEASRTYHMKRKHTEAISPSVTANYGYVKVEDNEIEQKIIIKNENHEEDLSPLVTYTVIGVDENKLYSSKKNLYTCNVCPQSFNKLRIFEEHTRIEHPGEKPFKCDECGKEFAKRYRLIEHTRRHSTLKPFKCDYCEMVFVGKPDLKYHIRTHTNDRRYSCPQCDKAFIRSSDLKNHIRIHTGEKPFVCDICSKSFRANCNLFVHKKSHVDKASRTYECEQCDKKFLRNIDRKVHMRTHTGEKPFKCEICQRGYSSRVNLRSHMERDHPATRPVGKKPFNCEICHRGYKSKYNLRTHVEKDHPEMV